MEQECIWLILEDGGGIDPRSQYTHEAYSYVWNNPISFNDPTGMEGELGFPIRDGLKDGEVWHDSDGLFTWNSTKGVWIDANNGSSVITQVTLTGQSKDRNSGPASLAMAALWTSQADSPAPGPADVVAAAMLIGAGAWWTYNQFTPPSTGYTTIANPGAGYGSMKTEDSTEEDKDVNGQDVPKEKKVPVSGKSGKEASKEVPSWVKEKGEAPYVDEDGKTFAKRVLDEHHGKGKWNSSKKDTGPTSDYNQIKKWGDRGFEIKQKK